MKNMARTVALLLTFSLLQDPCRGLTAGSVGAHGGPAPQFSRNALFAQEAFIPPVLQFWYHSFNHRLTLVVASGIIPALRNHLHDPIGGTHSLACAFSFGSLVSSVPTMFVTLAFGVFFAMAYARPRKEKQIEKSKIESPYDKAIKLAEALRTAGPDERAELLKSTVAAGNPGVILLHKLIKPADGRGVLLENELDLRREIWRTIREHVFHGNPDPTERKVLWHKPYEEIKAMGHILVAGTLEDEGVLTLGTIPVPGQEKGDRVYIGRFKYGNQPYELELDNGIARRIWFPLAGVAIEFLLITDPETGKPLSWYTRNLEKVAADKYADALIETDLDLKGGLSLAGGRPSLESLVLAERATEETRQKIRLLQNWTWLGPARAGERVLARRTDGLVLYVDSQETDGHWELAEVWDTRKGRQKRVTVYGSELSHDEYNAIQDYHEIHNHPATGDYIIFQRVIRFHIGKGAGTRRFDIGFRNPSGQQAEPIWARNRQTGEVYFRPASSDEGARFTTRILSTLSRLNAQSGEIGFSGALMRQIAERSLTKIFSFTPIRPDAINLASDSFDPGTLVFHPSLGLGQITGGANAKEIAQTNFHEITVTVRFGHGPDQELRIRLFEKVGGNWSPGLKFLATSMEVYRLQLANQSA